jgi:hypothetical protein
MAILFIAAPQTSEQIYSKAALRGVAVPPH